MKYRNIAINEWLENAKKLPNNTVGQLILGLINEREDKTISIQEWLFTVTDEDIFTAIEKSGVTEQPEVTFFIEE
jgi:hypothetical protein